MGLSGLSEYHADKARQHFSAGRLHDTLRCAPVSGYLASKRGLPCKPPEWMMSGEACFAGGFWVAAWKGHKNFLRETRARIRRKKAHDSLAVSDLFP